MFRFSFVLRAFAICAAMSLMAACGGGGGNESTASTQTTAPAIHSSATPTSSGSNSSSTQASTSAAASSQSSAQPTTPAGSGKSNSGKSNNADLDPLPPVDETPPEGPATGTARLAWLAPEVNADGTALSSLAGYRVRYGKTAATLDRSVDIKNPSVLTYTVENLTPGTWYFEVVAVNSDDMEGPASNVGSKVIS